jgi:hypothetical protein
MRLMLAVLLFMAVWTTAPSVGAIAGIVSSIRGPRGPGSELFAPPTQAVAAPSRACAVTCALPRSRLVVHQGGRKSPSSASI